MAQIIIAGTIAFASQEERDGAVAASAPFQQATRDDEPGCLAYSFSADPCQPTVVQVYELWADAESLEAHFLHPNYFDMRNMLGTFGRVSGGGVAKYRIDASGPVYNADRKATASFD